MNSLRGVSRILTVMLLCVLGVSSAHANPGAVVKANRRMMLVGDLFPLEKTRVVVVEQLIAIRLAEDGEHYDGEIRYDLQNPTDTESLDLVAPVIFRPAEVQASVNDETIHDGSGIKFDGRALDGCRPVNQEVAPSSPPGWPHNLVSNIHYCTVVAEIPPGRSTLRVEFWGAMIPFQPSSNDYVGITTGPLEMFFDFGQDTMRKWRRQEHGIDFSITTARSEERVNVEFLTHGGAIRPNVLAGQQHGTGRLKSAILASIRSLRVYIHTVTPYNLARVLAYAESIARRKKVRVVKTSAGKAWVDAARFAFDGLASTDWCASDPNTRGRWVEFDVDMAWLMGLDSLAVVFRKETQKSGVEADIFSRQMEITVSGCATQSSEGFAVIWAAAEHDPVLYLPLRELSDAVKTDEKPLGETWFKFVSLLASRARRDAQPDDPTIKPGVHWCLRLTVSSQDGGRVCIREIVPIPF